MNNIKNHIEKFLKHSPTLVTLWLGSKDTDYDSQISTKVLSRRNPLNYHNFHILKPSVWPFAAALSLLLLAFGLVNWFYTGKLTVLLIGLLQVIIIVFFWWSDVSQESGETTDEIVKNLKIGMALFIVSEVMFFFSFFWAFFQVSLVPGHEIGGVWPPVGLENLVIDPWSVPLLNTVLLLSSGVTVTCAHHALLYYFETEKLLSAVSFKTLRLRLKIKSYFSFERILLILVLLKKQAINLFFLGIEMLGITIILALLFTALQVYEYIESLIRISDSAYGSTFFVMTGFHGLHVIVGTIFLTVCLCRIVFNHFYYKVSVGLEASIWYWHFVDVIWILLYIAVYMWGNKQTKTKIKKEDFNWATPAQLKKKKEYDEKLAKYQEECAKYVEHRKLINQPDPLHEVNEVKKVIERAKRDSEKKILEGPNININETEEEKLAKYTEEIKKYIEHIKTRDRLLHKLSEARRLYREAEAKRNSEKKILEGLNININDAKDKKSNFEKQNLSVESLLTKLRQYAFDPVCEPFGVVNKPTPNDWKQSHYQKAPKGFKNFIKDLEKQLNNKEFDYNDEEALPRCHYNVKTYISIDHIELMKIYLQRKDVRDIAELRKLPEFQKYKHESDKTFIAELIARLKCNKEFAADRQLIAAELYGTQNYQYANSCKTFFSDNPKIKNLFKKNPNFSYDDLLKLDRATQKEILNYYKNCYQAKQDFSKNLTNEQEQNLIISLPKPVLDNWLISRLYRSIKAKIFGRATGRNDFAEPNQFGFQDSATPTMDGISDLHHKIMAFLILIFITVSWIMVACFLNKESTRLFSTKNGNFVESLKNFYNYHEKYVNDKYKRFKIKADNGDYLLIELFLPVYLKSKKRWIRRIDVLKNEGYKLLKADQILLTEGSSKIKKSYINSKTKLKKQINLINTSLSSFDKKIIIAQIKSSSTEIKQELGFFANEIDVQRIVFWIKHKENFEIFKKALKTIRHTKKSGKK